MERGSISGRPGERKGRRERGRDRVNRGATVTRVAGRESEGERERGKERQRKIEGEENGERETKGGGR